MTTTSLLNNEEKKFLLSLAREVIQTTAGSKKFNQPKYFSEILKKKLGVFVTLHKYGNLRGCIGYVEGIKPLQQAVQEMAMSAAFNDPRFPSVTAEEVDDIIIEISVLSPIKKINNTNEIEIGRHGLIIENGLNKGLLLPQVATEYYWDKKTFLEHTCRKAGLPDDAWQEKETDIYIFSAEIFSEKEV